MSYDLIKGGFSCLNELLELGMVFFPNLLLPPAADIHPVGPDQVNRLPDILWGEAAGQDDLAKFLGLYRQLPVEGPAGPAKLPFSVTIQDKSPHVIGNHSIEALEVLDPDGPGESAPPG